MNNAIITLTPAQLTKAQMGHTVNLNTGEKLVAERIGNEWKYTVFWEDQISLIRYAAEGLEAALWALNASAEEYEEEYDPMIDISSYEVAIDSPPGEDWGTRKVTEVTHLRSGMYTHNHGYRAGGTWVDAWVN